MASLMTVQLAEREIPVFSCCRKVDLRACSGSEILAIKHFRNVTSVPLQARPTRRIVRRTSHAADKKCRGFEMLVILQDYMALMVGLAAVGVIHLGQSLIRTAFKWQEWAEAHRELRNEPKDGAAD
jgi:hypothetical protein